MESKKSLIFRKGTPWCKRANSELDIGQGSYDGTESCELVGLLILHELKSLHLNVDIGKYMDDGLAETSSSPRQMETIKKIIKATYRKHGLEVTFEDNISKQVDFLDITMNLDSDTYKPFKTENTIL